MKVSGVCLLLHLVAGVYHTADAAAVGRQTVEKPDDPTGTDQVDWWASGQSELQVALKTCFNVLPAKNVILFIGDGMGMTTITAARWLQAQRNKASIHATPLSWEKFPHVGLSKTYNVDSKTPDSAGTATAYLSGVKARRGVVGVDQDVMKANCASMTEKNKLDSILHKSHQEGKWTGVVTTTSVTHATPAAAYARSPSRNWESDSDIPDDQKGCTDIAKQLIDENDFIRVILAGGRQHFLPKNETDPEHPAKSGERNDGRNLMQEWLERKQKSFPGEKSQLVMNRTDFGDVDTKTVEYLMGLFEPSHMQFEADREDLDHEVWGEPSLEEMTESAIKILSRAEQGFFLLVEGGMIDLAHHDGNAYRALDDTLALERAVAKADELTADDTLIIVTADHSHTFSLGGYPSINRDIFDITDKIDGVITDIVADDDLPYMTLSYANGPGYDYHYNLQSNSTTRRRNLTEDSISGKTLHKDYLQPAGVPLERETHGGEDTPVYAQGPMSHLLSGTHEQSYIAHVMMYASCVGDNKGHCSNDNPFAGPCTGPSSGVSGQRSDSLAGVMVMVVFSISSLLLNYVM